jgi:hypothetical protein
MGGGLGCGGGGWKLGWGRLRKESYLVANAGAFFSYFVSPPPQSFTHLGNFSHLQTFAKVAKTKSAKM